MAIRNILKEGEPALRKKSKDIIEFNERLCMLLDDMRDTLVKNDGVGLAAPQVGVLRRAIIVLYEGEHLEIVNPVIMSEEGSVVATEGCLSVDAKKNCKVRRPEKLVVKGYDRDGKPLMLKIEGWKARIVCHEVDHLDGILFIDKKYEEPAGEKPADGDK
jgi:peptide deformylase